MIYSLIRQIWQQYDRYGTTAEALRVNFKVKGKNQKSR